MRVQDVMCRPVVTCTEGTSLPAAARLMRENDCGVLPVMREGRLVGVVTDRDLCIAIATKPRSPIDATVKEAMSQSVATCLATDEVASALVTMGERRVRRLPVLDAKGQMVGILSLDDVVLRAEETAPGGARPAIAFGDVVRTFRSIAGARPIRRSA